MLKKISIFVCLTLLIIFITGFIVYMLNYSSPSEYFIFQDISECESLIPADQSDLMIEKYGTSVKDNNSRGLSYDCFWGMKFESDELKYEIFAYEFLDSDSALKYYVNVTGQKNHEKKLPLSDDSENKLLSSTKGISEYRIVAVYQNRAYLLIAPKQYEEEINALLANTFSYKLS